jgi:hypothetical protein
LWVKEKGKNVLDKIFKKKIFWKIKIFWN